VAPLAGNPHLTHRRLTFTHRGPVHPAERIHQMCGAMACIPDERLQPDSSTLFAPAFALPFKRSLLAEVTIDQSQILSALDNTNRRYAC
jgi:hypothetical protein